MLIPPNIVSTRFRAITREIVFPYVDIQSRVLRHGYCRVCISYVVVSINWRLSYLIVALVPIPYHCRVASWEIRCGILLPLVLNWFWSRENESNHSHHPNYDFSFSQYIFHRIHRQLNLLFTFCFPDPGTHSDSFAYHQRKISIFIVHIAFILTTCPKDFSSGLTL